MALFNEVFNRASIYDMFFFNVKAVLIYPTLNELKEKNPVLYNNWQHLLTIKLNLQNNFNDEIYQEKAIYYPEFTKIAAITYSSVSKEKNEKGEPMRFFKKIVDKNEFIIIASFIDVLHQLSSDGMKSTPKYFPMLCGHNIINYDIPLLIKRFILYRNKFEVNKQLPFILKNCLDSKPWESTVIDTVNLWKFNGNDYIPLIFIADYLDLKKIVDLDTPNDVSKKYWEIIENNPEEALNYIALQSATQTNFVMQLINELRQL
jgi:hypothetical protein